MAGGQTDRQTTLAGRAALSGVGVHTGRDVSLVLFPAEADSGLSFRRINGNGRRNGEIRADVAHVTATDHSTTVGTNGTSIATIEHVMATLGALGVDNAMIEVDGPEVPVMDGSAAPFVEAVDQAGIVGLDRPRRAMEVIKPVRVAIGESFAEFRPYDGMRIEVEIDFTTPLIGRQWFAADIDETVFRNELARARTFGFLAEVEGLWARGMALGASLENAVVIGEERIINPEGLRYDDEFVRHKALDAVGDLALAGAPIRGCYRSYRGGHRLNVMAVGALVADKTAWAWAGERITPARRQSAVAGGVPVYYGPDVS